METLLLFGNCALRTKPFEADCVREWEYSNQVSKHRLYTPMWRMGPARRGGGMCKNIKINNNIKPYQRSLFFHMREAEQPEGRHFLTHVRGAVSVNVRNKRYGFIRF